MHDWSFLKFAVLPTQLLEDSGHFVLGPPHRKSGIG
jgi:hypothetical protein